MPKCIVDYCRNYAGMKNNFTNVILHAFPTTLDRIKLWLQAIEQSGQIFGNRDEMAKKIYEGKKFDSYRVCSEHFTIQCYCVTAEKRSLKKESLPTVFVNRHAVHVSKQIKKRKRQEMLNTLDSRHLKKRGTESTDTKIGRELAQKLLNLTLEIIALLTGEDYIVVKKSCPRVQLDRRTECSEAVPESQVLDWVNEHMVLDLTSKMFDLLTGEEEDVTGGHEEASTKVTTKNPQSFPLAGVFQETNTAPPRPSSSGSMDVDEVVVQEAKHFKISMWTAISEANGTKKLVLCEEDAVQDSGSNEVETSSAHVVEEPLLPRGGNPQVYTQHVSTQEEPIPPSRGDLRHTDLSTQEEPIPPSRGDPWHTDLSSQEEPIPPSRGDPPHTDLSTQEEPIPPSRGDPQHTDLSTQEESILPSRGNPPHTDLSTQEEPIPPSRGDPPHTDLSTQEEPIPPSRGDPRHTDLSTQEESILPSRGNPPHTDLSTQEEPIPPSRGDPPHTDLSTQEEPIPPSRGDPRHTDLSTQESIPPSRGDPRHTDLSTQESIPPSRGNPPHTDLSTQCSSPGTTERSPCDGVIPSPDHAHNMDKEPRTSQRRKLTVRDIGEPSDHRQQDSSTHVKEETQSLPSLDHLQYTCVIINEEHLSPENSHPPHTHTPAVHPQHTALVIKEGPRNCADNCFTPTDTSPGDQTTSEGLKEEPDSCGEKTFTQPPIHTATSDAHFIFFTIK